jgi:hypothetical protein
MSFLEINNEQYFDLLNEGYTVKDEHNIKWVDVNSIDEATKIKQSGDSNQLRFIIKKKEDFVYTSTLLLRFTLECCRSGNTSQISRSVFTFVDLPDISNVKL